MQNILEKIITQKKVDLEDIKKKNSLADIDRKIKSTNNYLDFKKTLIKYGEKNCVSLIAEIKKAFQVGNKCSVQLGQKPPHEEEQHHVEHGHSIFLFCH